MREALMLLPLGLSLIGAGFACGLLVAMVRAETRVRWAVVNRCLSVDGDLYALFPMTVSVVAKAEGEEA